REEQNNKSVVGKYHLVASGETTWFDYANFVFETAKAQGEPLLIQEVNGISTSEYPTPATRPLNSRLSNQKFQRVFNVTLPDWKQGVERVVIEVLGK
ncbi:TPA: sugar nucleotide-binding protein, partial [Enterobacter hormaechei]